MVNINHKLKAIVKLVQEDKYFVINKPRQYGKTTTLVELEKVLKTRYKVIKLDFELLEADFESEKRFCKVMTECMCRSLDTELEVAETMLDLARNIEKITSHSEVILIIDEVDKASNNKLFINFLGILRSLYLSRAVDDSTTFKAVILAGVYDIKNLKLKLRADEELRYNSPWNIAVNFNVDMSFNEVEIGTMLKAYSEENNLNLDIVSLSENIYKFTGGYPFLVSRICQIIDENLLPNRDTSWDEIHILKAVKMLLEENNTLFDDLIKNMENNNELYEYMYKLLILNEISMFNIDYPIINLGVMFGYFSRNTDNNTVVENKIIRERIVQVLIIRKFKYRKSED